MKRLRQIKIPAVSIKIKILGLMLCGVVILGAGAIFNRSVFGKVMGTRSNNGFPGQVKSEAAYPAGPVPASPSPASSVLPSPSPSPTVVAALSPGPSPKSADPNRESQAVFVQPLYSGPPLPAASEKKELLAANFDSEAARGWSIQQDSGTSKVSGKSGEGLFIDGGKVFLKGGETFANSGTVSFWLKIEPKFGVGEQPILEWNFGGNDYSHSLFEVSLIEDRISFSQYNEKVDQENIEATISNPAIWHHVDITWDLTKAPFVNVLYIDGKKVAEGIFSFAPETNRDSAFVIGGNLGHRIAAKFTIDEIVMINWAKSEEEIGAGQ